MRSHASLWLSSPQLRRPHPRPGCAGSCLRGAWERALCKGRYNSEDTRAVSQVLTEGGPTPSPEPPLPAGPTVSPGKGTRQHNGGLLPLPRDESQSL